MKRFSLAFVLLAVSASASAQLVFTQPPIGVPAVLEVQRLAPQLLQFFGSTANFQNLVNGLSTGTPVTVTTLGADGLTSAVTFTPATSLTALQIAQTLESARQTLITRGITAPTAQQIGVTLVGGTLQTASGGFVQTPALVTQATAAAAAGATAATGATTINPAATIQQQIMPGAANTSGAPLRFTSDSLLPRGVSDSPPAPVQALPPGTASNTTTTSGTAGPASPASNAPAALRPVPASR